MFRKLFQFYGALQVGWSLTKIVECSMQIVAGDVSIGTGLLVVFLYLGIGVGSGLLLIFLDPHKVLHAGTTGLHQLVGPRSKQRSFAEKIGVSDSEESDEE